MQRLFKAGTIGLITLFAATASAQYAVGHRTFGIGTAAGAGYSRMDYQFPDIDANQPFYLLPTLEMKLFLSDRLSIDMSIPVVNIAASNALQEYFFVTGELYVNFHPTAPMSRWELFVAPGFGITYAHFEGEIAGGEDVDMDGYAFHVPVRIGMEFNNQRRNFSFFVAVRPFFSLVHAGNDNEAGGGGLLEIGIMAYTVKYQANRW